MRLIDAEKLEDFLDGLIRDEWNKNASTSWADAFKEVSELVKSIPESVVRCKDCKWFEIAQLKHDGTDDKRHNPSVCVRGAYAKPRKADWFCADGERREDGVSVED